MADGIHYYEWYFNDWLGSGTRADMSLSDRAIYRDLLDHQAANGSLPDDAQLLANRAMCSVSEMNAFIRGWGDRLFPLGEDGARRNLKLQENRDAILARLEARRTAGIKGASKRWDGKRNGKAIGKGNAEAIAIQNQNQNQGKPPHTPPCGGAAPVDDFLGSLWDLTPPKGRNRSSRKQVRDAWDKLSHKPEHDDVLAGMRKWRQCDDWTKDDGKFVPGLHTWVKNRKWENPPELSSRPDPSGLDPCLPKSPEQVRKMMTEAGLLKEGGAA